MDKKTLLKAITTTLLIGVISISMCGCNGKDDTTSEKESTSISIENESLENEIKTFIKGQLTEENKEYFLAVPSLNSNDRLVEFETIDKYSCDNAYYYKVKHEDKYYMYRFQMTIDSKIESYIKYELEA